MAKIEPVTTHREAASRVVPDGREVWIKVISPLEYTGLYLRISKTGGRSYYYRYTMKGKQRKIHLGSLSDTLLPQAAEQHAVFAKQVKSGIDIVVERQLAAKELQLQAAQPVGLTVKELIEKWLRGYMEVHVKKTTYKDASGRVYKWIIPRWGSIQADSINPAHVLQLRDEILAMNMPSTSNAVLGLLKQIFQWGIEELLVESNPAREIRRRGKVVHRSTAWSDSEIRTVWGALGTLDKPSELAVKLLLLTGCRRCEITSLEVSEITIDHKTKTGVIELPASRTKTGKRHLVYLPPFAVQLVEEAMEISTSDKYVLGHLWSRKQGKPIEPNTLGKRFVALLKKLGIPGTLHTARHTVATSSLKLGIDYNIVEAMLNHQQAGTGAIYTSTASNYPKLQKAWSLWAENVERIVSGEVVEDGSNVLQLFQQKA